MLVTFRCKQSGNTVSFSDAMDIETMRKEQHYEEIKHEEQKTIIPDAKEASANETRQERVLVKRGRPKSIN